MAPALGLAAPQICAVAASESCCIRVGRRDAMLADEARQCRVGHPERVANFRQRRARLAQQRATVIFGPSGIYGVDDAALRPMTFED